MDTKHVNTGYAVVRGDNALISVFNTLEEAQEHYDKICTDMEEGDVDWNREEMRHGYYEADNTFHVLPVDIHT